VIKQIFEPSEWKWRAWRICWILAATWILVDGALTRSLLPQLPLIAPDSFFYVLPAVNEGVYNIGPRTFVYPMFCRAVLQATGDWRGLSVVQHVLGLLGPALLLTAWWFLGAKIWVSRLARSAHETIGLGLPLLLVPSSVYVIYEGQAVLESLNAFFQCGLAALLCVLWLPMAPRRRLLLACLTASFGVFMYFANPRWGAAAPIVVALAAAAQESGLRNLTSADSGAVGIFQHRAGAEQGTREQLMDAEYSIRAFFGGNHSANPAGVKGLLDIPDWQNLSLAKAAQAVQLSANPSAYAKWQNSAWVWLDQLRSVGDSDA
jgi:hypothetical protein